MHSMPLIFSEKKTLFKPSVFFSYKIGKTKMVIDFLVKNSPIFAEPWRIKNKKSFALWEMDVVEFFGSFKGGSTYYEFQVSPYGQYFDLEIIEPRKKINLEYQSKMKPSAKILSLTSWKATMQIPLNNLKSKKTFSENSLYGNFFACLGRPFERFYFSAYLPKNKKRPDFHQPAFFRKL